LYIPVFVPGALFEVGDGHVAQGDGEVDQTAIETSLRGKIQLTVRKGMKLSWPRAETPTHYISMATDKDLTVATKTAIQEMIDFLAATKGLTKHEAYQLTSVAGDVAITELVDQTLGVHVKMPKGISSKGSRRYLILFAGPSLDRKSTRLNSSHEWISYAVFCLKKNTIQE